MSEPEFVRYYPTGTYVREDKGLRKVVGEERLRLTLRDLRRQVKNATFVLNRTIARIHAVKRQIRAGLSPAVLPEAPPCSLAPIRTLKQLDVTYSNIVGIYFLCRGDEVLYIGQSTDVIGRVNTHSKGAFGFDRVYYVECLERELNAFEGTFIRYFAPKGNGKRNAKAGEYKPVNAPWVSDPEEILQKFGLPLNVWYSSMEFQKNYKVKYQDYKRSYELRKKLGATVI